MWSLLSRSSLYWVISSPTGSEVRDSLDNSLYLVFLADMGPEEEKFLIKFFGNDYVQYRKDVGTGLPFMISQS